VSTDRTNLRPPHSCIAAARPTQLRPPGFLTCGRAMGRPSSAMSPPTRNTWGTAHPPDLPRMMSVVRMRPSVICVNPWGTACCSVSVICWKRVDGHRLSGNYVERLERPARSRPEGDVRQRLLCPGLAM